MTAAAKATQPATQPAVQRELVLTRTYDAPRSLVFKAWTDPQHMAAWWGPKGYTNPVCELDVRPGGAILIVMRPPADAPAHMREHPMRGVFHEIVEPELLVFTATVDDDDCNRLIEVLNTVTFAERSGKTTLTVRARVVTAAEKAAFMVAGMETGWNQTLDRFGDLVARIRP
jgi:uncharacterized protein YndB with AHSA1/START domain